MIRLLETKYCYLLIIPWYLLLLTRIKNVISFQDDFGSWITHQRSSKFTSYNPPSIPTFSSSSSQIVKLPRGGDRISRVEIETKEIQKDLIDNTNHSSYIPNLTQQRTNDIPLVESIMKRNGQVVPFDRFKVCLFVFFSIS